MTEIPSPSKALIIPTALPLSRCGKFLTVTVVMVIEKKEIPKQATYIVIQAIATLEDK